jgi:hypothetical protein
MPMCFNLFGPIACDLTLANAVVKDWWPDVPGKVQAVHFEWSPKRLTPCQFLENRSAFDVAFEMDIGKGELGIIGIETKYHEHCKAEKPPSENRLRRYTEVTNKSLAFAPGAIKMFVGTELQQIWLDHLLALSMLQHSSRKWTWAKFVLVHPAKNPSYANAAKAYSKLLADRSTFEVHTLESLLESKSFPKDAATKFQERYLW